MKVVISKKAINRINQFYYNVALKYPNTNSLDVVKNNINNVHNEIYKVGTSLTKTNTSLSKWKGYNVCRSKTWYFAYKIQNNTIYVYDAEHGQNMSEEAYTSQNSNNQQTNQPQQPYQQRQQPEYKPVPNQQYCHGLLMVSSKDKSNRVIYNYVNQNNQIFYPYQWFTRAENFRQWNRVISARVMDSANKWYFLTIHKKLFPIKGGITDNYRRFCQKILSEHTLSKLCGFS